MSPTETPADGEDSVRPLVASPGSNRSLWLFGIVLAAGGVMLFRGLESRRDALVAPPITLPADRSAGFIAAPPDLEVPPSYEADGYAPQAWPYSVTPQMASPANAIIQPPQRPAPLARSGASAATISPLPPLPPPTAQEIAAAQASYQPPSARADTPEPPVLEGSTAAERGKERVEAARFANPATTVPKGTVIQAVLETALDSNRAGFARAIVSRDVLGFDGTRVLIPRGSRIIGEYKSDIALGQNRVLIQWQRLMRPDGVMINMDSPSADPLGRAGIRGKVNTHFFQRFAGAILQSALDVGTQLATREVSRDSIYIGLPGLSQAIVTTPEKIQPTVTVRQGKSVSVFVARDLDFTKVGQ